MPATCDVEARNDPFYVQGCTVDGIDVVGSAAVSAPAIEAAADRVAHMLAFRPDVAQAVAEAGIRVVVIAATERITDLPEFTTLYRIYPGTDWHRDGRSFPGTDLIPVAAGAEENLLCLDGDRYAGEDMFVRDFARAIRHFGLATADEELDRQIERTYARAIAAGRWSHTIARVNSDQYWAEGTQSFYDANQEADPPDGIHNHVDTREELRAYDPGLERLLEAAYGVDAWRPNCP